MITMLSVILILCLFFIFFVPTLLFSIIAKILSLFGGGTRKKSVDDKQEFHGTSYTHSKSSKKEKNKKIFDKNEGEYVDFEEIE